MKIWVGLITTFLTKNGEFLAEAENIWIKRNFILNGLTLETAIKLRECRRLNRWMNIPLLFIISVPTMKTKIIYKCVCYFLIIYAWFWLCLCFSASNYLIMLRSQVTTDLFIFLFLNISIPKLPQVNFEKWKQRVVEKFRVNHTSKNQNKKKHTWATRVIKSKQTAATNNFPYFLQTKAFLQKPNIKY